MTGDGLKAHEEVSEWFITCCGVFFSEMMEVINSTHSKSFNKPGGRFGHFGSFPFCFLQVYQVFLIEFLERETLSCFWLCLVIK